MQFYKQNEDTSQNEKIRCSSVVKVKVLASFNTMHLTIQTDTIKLSINEKQHSILFDNKLLVNLAMV